MTALVAWLWQGAAIALTTAALLGLMRRLNAATRHAIWWCALAAVLAAPLVRAALSAADAGPATIGPMSPGVLVLPSIPDWAIAAAIGAWLGTLLVGFARIAAGLRSLARLKTTSSPVDPARESRLVMWRSTGLCRRRPELRVSDGARAACALGLRHPVILLSQDLVDALDDEALDQVVMHEHAHLLRYDDWLRFIESAIVAVAGLHPAVRFIARQIDLEREAACDDAVVTRTGGARRYAACLADAAAIAARSTSGPDWQLLPSATGATVPLRARIARLLDPRRARGAHLAPLATAAGLLMLAGAIALSHHTAPILVVTDASLNVPTVSSPGVSDAATTFEPGGQRAVAPPAASGSSVVNSRRSAVQRSARVAQAPGSAPLEPQPSPSDLISGLSAHAPDTMPVPLPSSSIAATVQAPHSIVTAAVRPGGARDDRREAGVKWSSFAAPGVAIGRGAKSIAGFFGGAAKAVATTF